VTTHAAERPIWSTRSTGWVPFALVALVLVPTVAGSLRLAELSGGELTTTLMLGAGWAVNLIVAEHVIRRHSSSRTSRATAEVGSS
jgi:hypothetical protein